MMSIVGIARTAVVLLRIATQVSEQTLPQTPLLRQGT